MDSTITILYVLYTCESWIVNYKKNHHMIKSIQRKCLIVFGSLCFSCVRRNEAGIGSFTWLILECEENIQSFHLNITEAKFFLFILIICKTRPGPGRRDRGRFNRQKKFVNCIQSVPLKWIQLKRANDCNFYY